MHTVSASLFCKQMDSTHTRTPSMSKPLDEYALLNFDGLEVVSSSLVLKLSSKISLPFHLTFALMSTYCHCFVALRMKFVELSDASEQANPSPLCFGPARLVLGQE